MNQKITQKLQKRLDKVSYFIKETNYFQSYVRISESNVDRDSLTIHPTESLMNFGEKLREVGLDCYLVHMIQGEELNGIALKEVN